MPPQTFLAVQCHQCESCSAGLQETPQLAGHCGRLSLPGGGTAPARSLHHHHTGCIQALLTLLDSVTCFGTLAGRTFQVDLEKKAKR